MGDPFGESLRRMVDALNRRHADAAQVNLRCVDRPVIDPAVRDREELLSAVMTVASTDEIKQLFLELQGKNVAFFPAAQDATMGARNFIIKDPDGNLLLFAGPAK